MKSAFLAIPLVVTFSAPAVAQSNNIDDIDLRALDTDGDGAVSSAEFAAFAEFAFDAIDKNSDGSLSPDEVDDHVVGDAFRLLDDDGSGSVSAAEFSSQLEDDFREADEDGDGKLD